MWKIVVFWSCLFFSLLAAGCSGSSGSSGSGPNSTPTAQITNPFEGDTFDRNDVIQFMGTGMDDEDGDLGGEALKWYSDIDGLIGTGRFVEGMELSSGVHQITLNAVDSREDVGMDTIEIFISAIPHTGQIYKYTGTFGEDADYTNNLPFYCRRDASDAGLDDVAPEWVTVKEELLGLSWEVKTDDGGIHDKDNTYTWYEAQDFIDNLNADEYGSFSDWRLPTIKELATLVDASCSEPAIRTLYFPNTNFSAPYASSTPDAKFYGGVWLIHFGDGSIAASYMSDEYYVRAVRGELLTTNSLLDNGDGTITDLATGLMWQQGESDPMTWEEALAYCESLQLAGYDDWRLPNRNELQSLVDYETYDPAIDIVFFPDAISVPYWSSTTYAYVSDGAWVVYFFDGSLPGVQKTSSCLVRAVRGGSGRF